MIDQKLTKRELLDVGIVQTIQQKYEPKLVCSYDPFDTKITFYFEDGDTYEFEGHPQDQKITVHDYNNKACLTFNVVAFSKLIPKLTKQITEIVYTEFFKTDEGHIHIGYRFHNPEILSSSMLSNVQDIPVKQYSLRCHEYELTGLHDPNRELYPE